MCISTPDTVTLSGSETRQEDSEKEKPKSSETTPVHRQRQISKDYVDAIANLDDPRSIHTDPIVAQIAEEYRCCYQEALSRKAERIIHDTEDELVLEEVKGLAKAICNRFPTGEQEKDLSSNVILKILYCTPGNWRNSACDDHSKRQKISYRQYILQKQLVWVHRGTVREIKGSNATNFFCPVLFVLQLAVKHTARTGWMDAIAQSDSGHCTSPLSYCWTLARRDPLIGPMTADVVALVAMGCSVQERLSGTAHFERLRSSDWIEKLRAMGLKSVLTTKGSSLKEAFMRAKEWLQASPATRATWRREERFINGWLSEAPIIIRECAEELQEEGDFYAQCIEEGASLEERRMVFKEIRYLVLLIFANSQGTTNRDFGREPPVPKTLFRAVAKLGQS